MPQSYATNFICADTVDEFEHILYIPTRDEEIKKCRDGLRNIIKNYPRLKAKLTEELDYQISKAESDHEIHEDLCFTSFALHILGHVKCRQAVNYIWRILKLTEKQSVELDIKPIDLAQIISSLVIDGDQRYIFRILKDETVPLLLKSSIIQPLDYMINNFGISQKKVGEYLIPVLQEAVNYNYPVGEFIVALTAAMAATHKIESLKNELLKHHENKELDFGMFDNVHTFLNAYESEVKVNHYENVS